MSVDYKIGSLSELITGSKTPNKIKVVKTKFRDKNKTNTTLPAKSTKQSKDDSPTPKKRKTKSEKLSNGSNIEQDRKEETLNIPQKHVDRKTKREKAKQRKALEEERKVRREAPDESSRTVFVGNVPLDAHKTKLKKFFLKYGNVESVRFRCPPIKTLKTTKKLSVIKKEFHQDRKSWVAYVKFEHQAHAKQALKANGEIFKDHHLRVSMSKQEDKPDESKAIFIGNLPLKAEEEQLWRTFEPCGKIESVRIVRDKTTGMGKGFAYVNFASADAVQLALEMGNVTIDNKELRIKICNAKAAKKNKLNANSKVIKKKERHIKRTKTENIEEKKELKKGDKIDEPKVINRSFEGTKVDVKKKKKKSLDIFRKKKIAKKVAPKI